jgi:beta-phosphoglucomutase
MSKTQPITFSFCEANAIRALIFDWDGVLLDSGHAYYCAYERVLHEAGVSITPREIYLREGQPTGQLLVALFTQRGIALDESMIQAMVDRRRQYQSAIGTRNFFPGVWRLLADLRAAGYKLAMVTGSSRKSVELVLTKELESRFDAVITADDVKRPKPNPEPFLLAAEILGIPAPECLVVENAPFGIEAAHGAGCPVIGICTTLSAEDLQRADWVVPDHGALELLLSSVDKQVRRM